MIKLTQTLIFLAILSSNLYSASAHEWKMWGSLGRPRAFGYVAAVSPTSAIVFGGFPDFFPESQNFGSRVLRSCELLDVKTGEVRYIDSTAVGHADGPVVKMSNGKIVVLGGVTDGNSGMTKLVEEFDPVTEAWATIGSMMYSRRQHQAIVLDDHRIMIVGGRDASLAGTSTVEIFDVSTGTSTKVASHPHRLTNHRVMMVDSSVYILGGRVGAPGSPRFEDVYYYDEVTDEWTKAFDLPHQLPLAEGVQVFGGAFISGGSIDLYDSEFSDIVYYIDGDSATALTGRLETSVKGHSMLPWIGDSLIAFAGENNSRGSASESSWINTLTGEVSEGPDLNIGRRYGMAIFLEGDGETPSSILAIGGAKTDNDVTEAIEILSAPIDEDLLIGKMLDPKTVDASGAALLTPSSTVRLTADSDFETGAIWSKSKISLQTGVSTSFSFRLTNNPGSNQPTKNSTGADGLAFVIQNGATSPTGTQNIGLGYEDITNAIAVEINTFMKPQGTEQASSLIAVQAQRNRKLKSTHEAGYTIGTAPAGTNLRGDGTVYYARVDFKEFKVDVYLDTIPTFTQPLLTIPATCISNLISLGLDGSAWVGITGGSGYGVKEHEVLSWSIETNSTGTVDVEENIPTVVSSPSIAPMPSSEFATLLWTGAQSSGTVYVYDATGNRVWTSTLEREEIVNGMQLPSSGLATGLYVIQIVTPKAVSSVSWIVQH
ncbi:MAG: kelch repeat-containing protein [bacterium]|nr:kelch repeat-containing protein [bacterium]